MPSLLKVSVALSLLGPVLAEPMACAVEGEEPLCGSASDMAVLNTSTFSKSLETAGRKAYARDTTGVQALTAVLGAGALSDGCLACQGASLDCSVQQSECFSICSDSGNCAKECKECIHKYCDVQKACGGVAGVTVQIPYICADTNAQADLTASAEVLNVEWLGECSTGCVNTDNGTECSTSHHLSGTSRLEAGLAVLLTAAASVLVTA